MRKKFLICTFIIFTCLLMGACSFGKTESNEESNLYKGAINMIYEDNIVPKDKFLRENGQIYFEYGFIKDVIDPNVFYDENEKKVIFTHEDSVKVFTVDAAEGLVNNQTIGVRDPVMIKDGKVFVPTEVFIYDYPVNLKFIEDKALILMDRKNVAFLEGTAKGDANVYDKNESGAGIVFQVKSGENVFVVAEDGDYYKIRQPEGFLGWIKKSKIVLNTKELTFKYERKNATAESEKSAPINMTWDYFYEQMDPSAVRDIPGINVICPTSFSVVDENGNLKDKGNHEYVNAYKNKGLEVWGVVDNGFDHGMGPDKTHAFLSSSSKRMEIERKLVSLVESYGMQGLNIDFENINEDDRDNLVQFVRELYPQLKTRGLKLSICVTPISDSGNWSKCYDRKRLAETVDYVCVMAYDQHWASSQVAGSVAQYRWVEQTINAMYRQVPLDKMILGIPLYTRVWVEKDGKVSSQSVSMEQADKFVADNKVHLIWDEESGQYYGELDQGNRIVKLWLENEKSVAKKAGLYHKYNLKGVATWRKGFDKPAVWESLKAVVKN